MHEDFFIPAHLPDDAPFRLSLAGSSYCDGHYSIQRSGMPLMVVEYVESGKGKLTVNGTEYEPAAGSVYLIHPWTQHYYRSSADAPWVKHWFNCEGDSLPEKLIDAMGLSKCVHLPDFPHGELFINGLQRIAEAKHEEQQQCAFEVICGILLAMRQELDKRRSGRPQISSQGKKLRHFLQLHLNTPVLPLADMAGTLHCSPGQVIRICKRDFATTPVQLHQKMKMEAAATLLTASGRTIKEIAAMLGYDDQYYFARVFKKLMHISPGQYRKRSHMSDTL